VIMRSLIDFYPSDRAGAGDDCISIVSGSEFVRATGIFCGPGHGIRFV
jgi:hypothetical protein